MWVYRGCVWFVWIGSLQHLPVCVCCLAVSLPCIRLEAELTDGALNEHIDDPAM